MNWVFSFIVMMFGFAGGVGIFKIFQGDLRIGIGLTALSVTAITFLTFMHSMNKRRLDEK